MSTPRGEVPEWLNGAVSKTVVVLWATVGSNPTLSARKGRPYIGRPLCILNNPSEKLPGSKRLWSEQPGAPYTRIRRAGQTTIAFEQIEIATFSQLS
jgi:hypothetical protein